jgi:hypothetical protein
MSKRRRDDETRNYDDDEPRRPARKRPRPRQEGNSAFWVLSLIGLVVLGGAVGAGLWWRSRKTQTTTQPPPAGTTAGPAAQPAAGAVDTKDLDAAIAEADRLDPGWRWDQLWAKRAAVPDGLNGARVVVEAGRLLPLGGQELPSFVERAGETRLDEAQLAELNAWLAPRQAAIRSALTLADRPTGRYDIKVAPDYISTLLPDIQTARQVVTVLRGEAARRAETGNPGRLGEFRAMLNASRSVGDEPILISQLVRMAIANQAIRSLEQTLARTTPNEEALAAAQKALSEETGFNGLLVGWRGERAVMFGFLEAIDTGKVSLEQVRKSFSGFSKQLNWPAEANPGTPGLCAARAWNLRRATGLVEVARKPSLEQPAALAELQRNTKQAPPGATVLDDAVGELRRDSNVQRSFQRRDALLRSAIVALAAERYRLRKGRWPLEAKEMDASLVGPVAIDPYDGSPLRFRRLDDGLVVYAIGPDGRDDGGDLGDRGEKAPDIGFRLWDAAKRR